MQVNTIPSVKFYGSLDGSLKLVVVSLLRAVVVVLAASRDKYFLHCQI